MTKIRHSVWQKFDTKYDNNSTPSITTLSTMTLVTIFWVSSMLSNKPIMLSVNKPSVILQTVMAPCVQHCRLWEHKFKLFLFWIPNVNCHPALVKLARLFLKWIPENKGNSLQRFDSTFIYKTLCRHCILNKTFFIKIYFISIRRSKLTAP